MARVNGNDFDGNQKMAMRRLVREHGWEPFILPAVVSGVIHHGYPRNDNAHPIFRDLLNNITTGYAAGVKRVTDPLTVHDVLPNVRITSRRDDYYYANTAAPRPEHAHVCHCGRVLDFRVDTICPCVPEEESVARAAAMVLSGLEDDEFEVIAVDIQHHCLGGEK